MGTKRRDAKGRVLRAGESQQKDGRYRYTYYIKGKQHCFYSWKLEDTDRLPQGKHPCESLRSQVKELDKSLEQGIAFRANGISVLGLVEKYLAIQNANDKLKTSTKAGYRTSLKHIREDAISTVRIDKVKKSDAKRWVLSLHEKGFGYSTISSIHGVIKPSFQMAVDDDLILKNPFEFQLATVIVNDSVTREAITLKQERQFLSFVKSDNHFSKYYEGICILFKTGLRISEFCGLTLADIDMKQRTINVNHQLQRSSKMEYLIEDTKTSAGTRVLPMTDEVYECFKTIIQNRPKPKKEPMVGGRTGFLYLDKNGMPMVALHWEKYFEHIVEKYNKIYRVQMPKVTPHVCRHTYCSNCARAGMNPKTLQYLMGHSDIGVTLNVYTHLGYDDAKAELSRINMAGTSQSHACRKQA